MLIGIVEQTDKQTGSEFVVRTESATVFYLTRGGWIHVELMGYELSHLLYPILTETALTADKVAKGIEHGLSMDVGGVFEGSLYGETYGRLQFCHEGGMVVVETAKDDIVTPYWYANASKGIEHLGAEFSST